jgi:hypothetical protein
MRLPRDERRMIVAHETAHYWYDYEMPRRRMAKRFGKDGVHLLDKPISDIDLLMASASGASHSSVLSLPPERRTVGIRSRTTREYPGMSVNRSIE